MTVTHWAAAKERRDGTIARPSEDAYLFCSSALGVCDGVGGWEARGVDSGAYSRGLCAGAARALHDATVEDRLEYLLPKPLLLLQAGYQHACDQRLEGSSTALVRPHWCRSTHALRSLVLQPSCRRGIAARLLACSPGFSPRSPIHLTVSHAGGHTHRQPPPHGVSRRLRAARRP
jgi:serine/threonine protein phosphatase PrpC